MKGNLEILLVEDSSADVRLTAEALKDAGIRCDLQIVRDGEDAIRYLLKTGAFTEAREPDLIILDLNLPKKSGHDVMAEMQKRPHLNHIPVIVLTVSTSEDDIKQGLDRRMNCYLNKPVDAARLGDLIRIVSSLWKDDALAV
jgi:two-component system, chemotaxis family, response regulator Rcp1